MSYIRCLTNPEGLYIWGDVSGDAIISTRIGSPSGEPILRHMPNELWEKLLRTWKDSYFEENIAVMLVIDGMKHEATLTERLEPYMTGHQIGRLMICLTYKNSKGVGWQLDGIWPTTMHYIVENATNPYLGANWLKRKLLEFLGV